MENIQAIKIGDFIEFFGDDAERAAEILPLNVIKDGQDRKVAGFLACVKEKYYQELRKHYNILENTLTPPGIKNCHIDREG